tara:strand:- start:14051 stop:15490 length:1440 start_codon:yes stop_codon:yes gene_type:complete
MANGPVPAYVAPLQPSKTFSEAITQGTQNLGPLMAAAARNNLARETARRRQRDENLKELRGYDTSGWAEKHRDIFEEQRLLAANAFRNGDPMASTIFDNVSISYDFFKNHAEEVAPQRKEYEKGVYQIGSLDTETSKFTGDAAQLLEHDAEYDAGGIGEYTVNPDGSITAQYVGASGESLGEIGNILNAPGINRQGYYTRDFGPQDNVTPEQFAALYRATANDLVAAGEPPEKIRADIKDDMLDKYDTSKVYSASANNFYSDLEAGVIDFKNRYVEAALDLLGMDKPDATGGSSKQLSVDVIENRTRAEITQEELQQYGRFADTLGPDQDAVGQNYVMTELEKGKGLDLPNPEYDPLYKESPYDDASKIRLKKTPIVNEKVRTIQVFPEMDMLVIKGGLKGEYRVNYAQPNEQEQDILEQLRQAMNEAYEGELTLEMLLDPDRAIRNVSYFQGQDEQQPAAGTQASVNDDPLGILRQQQ